jgi:hypothetical protein
MDCNYYFCIIPRKCSNQPDTFCYVCSELTFRCKRQSFTLLIKTYYEFYFECKMDNQGKRWAPHICYLTCVRFLAVWINVSHQMLFAFLMVRKEPKYHSSECYLCLTIITGSAPKFKHSEISRLAICNEACPTQWKVACTKASGKSDF